MPRKKESNQIQDQEEIPVESDTDQEIPPNTSNANNANNANNSGNSGNSDSVQEMIAELRAQGISTPEQLRQYLSNVSTLSIQIQELQQRQREAQNLQTELEDLKTLTAKAKEIQELKKVFPPSSSPLESALAWKILAGNNQGVDQLRQELQQLLQQLLAGNNQEIDQLRQELQQLRQQLVESQYSRRIAEVESQYSRRIAEVESQYSRRIAEVESQYSRRIAELESMIQAYAQQPRPNPIQEIKGIIETYKTLQQELSSLGIGKEPGKESLLSTALDKIGAKLATMAEQYGLIDMLTGQAPAQGTGSLPPPPSGNPGPPAGPTTYTQAEFNQASQEWINRIRGKLQPGQVVVDDQGFIAGRDPTHIRRYIASHPQQIQPFIQDDYYVVPNIYARDFIAFCTMPSQGKGGVNAPRPGF